MVISQRCIAKQEFTRELHQIESNVTKELSRRVSMGVTQTQAMIDLIDDVKYGRWEMSSPSAPGTSNEQQSSNQVPSMVRLKRFMDALRNIVQMNAEGNGHSASSAADQRLSASSAADQRLSASSAADQRLSASSAADQRQSTSSAAVQRQTTTNTIRSNEVHLRDPDIPSYQYNPANFRYDELTLKQAIKVMSTFDFDLYYEYIKSTLCMFSLRIYGLDDCSLDDLRLAVFFFIEEYFHFQPVIELCVRHISDPSDPNVVGVLFERIETASRIFRNRNVLDNTQYIVSQNVHADWIIWNYDG